MAEFVPLGGAGEIGATCFYVNMGGTGVLLDCGMHPRKRGTEALPRFDLLDERNLDFCLVTHAHADHIGALPYLVQRHPYVRLFSTPSTRAIAELTLHDAVSILQQHLGEHDTLRPYSHKETDLLIQSIGWHVYDEAFELRGMRHHASHALHATFFDAGHILGSAGIVLQAGDERIVYTGDICLDRQSLLPGTRLPEAGVKSLILECTNGANEFNALPLRYEEAKRFARRANEVLGAGGSILIPVFAVGKMQEMLALIWDLMQKGSLASVDIYTGGLGRRISRIYDANRYIVPRVAPGLELVSIPQRNLHDEERGEEFLRTPSIVLAASGMMLDGTRSFTLAKRWLEDPRHAIFLVGYMDPETPGYRIASAERGSTVQLTELSKPQRVRCSIERFRFTAHARREGLLEIVERLNPRQVVLVHGSEEAIRSMGELILHGHPRMRVWAAEVGKVIEL